MKTQTVITYESAEEVIGALSQSGDTPSPGNGYKLVIRRGQTPYFERAESRDDKVVFRIAEAVTNGDLLTTALSRHGNVDIDLRIDS